VALQVSAPSQALPLSQSASLAQQPAIGALTQPPAPLLAVGSQLSAVQTTLSSQLGAAPLTHRPVLDSQVSTPLQNWPSSQVTTTWSHTWCPVSQVSVVHASRSSQSASVLQHPAIGSKVHDPVVGSQPSTVQASPSTQTTGVPG